jgi:glutamyl-tRNA synthetase
VSREQLDEHRGWLDAMIDLVKTRSRTLVDLVEQARPFFPGLVPYQEDAVAKFWVDQGEARRALEVMSEFVAREERWDDVEGMEARLRALADERGIPAGKVMQATRVAITGARVSPGIFETMAMMGKPLVANRLATAIEHLSETSGADLSRPS